MWKLLKEVFRSLTKNKITLAGLTILVFLSSGIFTLFHDISKSMKTQFKQYKEDSNGHDLTIDLNIPSSGSMYNNGYYVNGLTQFNGGVYYDKPLNYIQQNYKQIENIINFDQIDQNYLQLSSFVPNQKEFANKYIRTTDFIKFYNAYQNPYSSDKINLNYVNPQKSFTITSDYILPTYKKENQDFKPFFKKLYANKSQKYVLDRDYKFTEIANLNSIDDQIIVSQLVTLFVNIKTGEMTFDFIKGKNWEVNEESVRISDDKLATLLGLSKYKNQEKVYFVDRNLNSNLIIYPESNKLSDYYNVAIIKEQSYSHLFGNEDVVIDVKDKFTFYKNTEYNVPLKWASEKTTITYFKRKLYESTFDEKNKDKWTGSYKTFIENIFKNPELKAKYLKFSYWEKEINTYTRNFNDKGILNTQARLTNSLSRLISFDEANQVKLTLAQSEEQPRVVDLERFKLITPQTIAQIEGRIGDLTHDEYNKISNKEYKENIVKSISDGALQVTKNTIIEKTINFVGAENVGYRETMTVDSVDDKGVKSVFNIVNIGDNLNQVHGVENNVDKLINETQKSTLLTEKAANLDDYFKTKQINPVLSQKIIEYAISNVVPSANYLKPDFNYDTVIIKDRIAESSKTYRSKKVYRLANYILEDNSNQSQINVFNGYGITYFSTDKIYIVKADVDKNGQVKEWINISLADNINGVFDISELLTFLNKYQWTLRMAYINPKGWVEINSNFPNTVSIPTGYRGPRGDVLQEALSKNSLKIGVDYIQKMLYESDLVKNNFLTKEEIYVLMDSINAVLRKNNFARIFSSGNINVAIIPKMALDLIYELSHNHDGDYVTKIFNSLLTKIKNLISEKPTLKEQKEYLTKEVQKFFNFTEKIFGFTITNSIPIDTLVNLSKNPIVFIDGILEMIQSLDLRGFTDLVEEFIQTQYDKIIKVNGEDRQRKFSIIEIINWLAKSIDQYRFKAGLFKILDNLDLPYIFENPNALQSIIKTNLASVAPIINQLIQKLNSPEYFGVNKYKNIIDGIKFFISNFDLKVFANSLEKQIQIVPYDQVVQGYNQVLNTYELITKHYAAGSVQNTSIYYSLLLGFFSIPGLDRGYKEEIVKMFNLSRAGTAIKLDENNYLNIPAKDSEHLGIFDLLTFVTKINGGNQTEASTNKATENTPKNNLLSTQTNDGNRVLLKVQQMLEYLKKLDRLEIAKESEEVKNLLTKYFGFTEETILNKEQILDFVTKWEQILTLFALDTKDLRYHEDMSIGALGNYFVNFDNYPNSPLIWVFMHKLLKQLVPLSNVNQYSAAYNVWVVFQEWWNLYVNALDKGISYEKATSFLNDLLELANQKEIIDSFNSFKLFQPSDNNIALSDRTQFGISRSLANVSKMKELFFEKDANGNYVNTLLKALFEKYPEFKDIISKKEIQITTAFSYIAASESFYNVNLDSINETPIRYKGLQSVVIDNFLNGFLKNALVSENYKIINRLINNNFVFPISVLGIPQVILTPVLIPLYPQTLVWFLTDSSSVSAEVSKKANLAYLVENKLINLEELVSKPMSYLQKFINLFIPETILNSSLESDFSFSVAIDNDYLVYQFDSLDYKQGLYTSFGINLYDLIYKSLESITSYQLSDKYLSFSQNSSFLVKANYAWLKNNNKAIYTGSIPSNPVLMQQFLDDLDNKYIVSINGAKYLIVGEDNSYDYIYPVIDESNLQVDTRNQAILFVNDKGFARARYSYQGNAIKEYLTIAAPKTTSIAKLEKELEEIVQSTIGDPSKRQRVYSINEIDGLNPERSLRIYAIDKIISTVSNTSFLLTVIMMVIVAISIIFIIKRYISNKNKVLGILVAQGYTPLQIATSTTMFAVFSGVVGGVSGYLVGFLSQAIGIKIISAFWTIPIVTLQFSIISFALTVIFPIVGMAFLIILVTLWSLRHKAIDLMSGSADLIVGDLQRNYQKLFKKRNVKTRFSASLIFNSFWKLVSFGSSIILTSIATIFQFSTIGVFEKTISKTYENRNYKYRFDLVTPTLEGGAILPFNNNLENNLYVPIGNISEYNQMQADYFKPGYSTAVNVDNANGEPNQFDAHVITQFSVNVKISGTVQLDPWNLIYNALPDSQKARIIKQREEVANLLERTQDWVVFYDDGKINIRETGKSKRNFFHYLPNDNVVDGKFYYFKWNDIEKEYEATILTTSQYRDEYRKFLVEGYKKIPMDSKVNDYFVSFNGVYFNENNDEVYTYVDSKFKDSAIRIYGYKADSKQVSLIDESNKDLMKLLNDTFEKNNFDINKPIPLVINNVARDQYLLKLGSIIEIPVYNTVDRYTKEFEKSLNDDTSLKSENTKTYKFEVVGINPTFINKEFIIPKKAADKLTGLDRINGNPKFEPFNGILSKDSIPQQLISSASLYSLSGYFGATQSFDIKSWTLTEKQDLFDAIFGNKDFIETSKINGVMSNWGWDNNKIAKFIDSSFNPEVNSAKEVFEKARQLPDLPIEKFTKIYNNGVYVPVASSLDSKDIEVGFTKTIADTGQIVVTFITLLTFVVSMIILVTISNILINENEKNIAIWSILGYNKKEKLKMFFGIYIPFLIGAILISIPITFGLMVAFSATLTTVASIAIPLSLSFFSVSLAFVSIFAVFMITSFITWRNINKIKAIDLLKGK
ncbi:ABC transporter permease [Mycoplasmopsis sturni]|uniref:ABC transporter permease n=1 Tax=Mycoplasmopsis sturni TaxID=39047 RepID=UPI00056569CF|nr:FtsX-like permease family protein [Mycoplasmopsis sturni]